MRPFYLVLIFLLGPPIALGLLVAIGLAMLWLWHQLPEFQYWGVVIGVACYLAMGCVLVWAYEQLRKPEV